ncbi:type II toxin-antitoxin system RelE/ParE family toxin [Myroides fluvii]|uniref:type II toxin-antitoxin system RelE/ParE family toxin n=1 Tax=Myroides fluvii TaxID=2572594 RepID=UPI00131AF6BD|nr:type II toxin-antitoxin system RelE/ParE family toxin [Myroides fluvii]
MIKTFKSKNLKSVWETGNEKGLPPNCVRRIAKILNLIDQVSDITDLGAFGAAYRIHKLKSPPYIGYYSMDVTGNFRIIFEIEKGNVYHVHFLDTH